MIRVGIGGWNFAPWRGSFYPADLSHKEELGFASRAVTTIEINATFYRTQSATSFARWAAATPDDFIFSVKAHRVTTHRSALKDAREAIERFLASGLVELGAKLGPVLWQLPPTKRFDPDDLNAFLEYLPARLEGRRLRHVLEVRHETFRDPKLPVLLRKHKVALCLAESDKYPMLADVTADFVYLRLQRAKENLKAGYSKPELAGWAKRITDLKAGRCLRDLPAAGPIVDRKVDDCFVYFIGGAKLRAPHAARALLAELGQGDEEGENSRRATRA